jgi:hypothetical protein
VRVVDARPPVERRGSRLPPSPTTFEPLAGRLCVQSPAPALGGASAADREARLPAGESGNCQIIMSDRRDERVRVVARRSEQLSKSSNELLSYSRTLRQDSEHLIRLARQLRGPLPRFVKTS